MGVGYNRRNNVGVEYLYTPPICILNYILHNRNPSSYLPERISGTVNLTIRLLCKLLIWATKSLIQLAKTPTHHEVHTLG